MIGANDHDEVFDQDGAAYLIYGQAYGRLAQLGNPLTNAGAVFIGATQNDGFADDIEGLAISMVMDWLIL